MPSTTSGSINSPRSTVNIVRCQFQKQEDRDLYELVILSGLVIDPEIFSILVDLLRLDISPSAIYTMLQVITAHSKPPTQQRKPQATAAPSKSTSVPIINRKKPATTSKPVRKPHFSES